MHPSHVQETLRKIMRLSHPRHKAHDVSKWASGLGTESLDKVLTSPLLCVWGEMGVRGYACEHAYECTGE